MGGASQGHGAPGGHPDPWGLRHAVPAWLLSVLVHVGLFVALGVSWRLAPIGAADEPSREVGIVLRRADAEQPRYESPDDADASPAQPPTQQPSLAELVDEAPPFDPADALPTKVPLVGAAPEPSALPSASDLTRGGPARAAPSSQPTRTSVFGIEGQGNRFLYVFDRSGSMGGVQHSALAAAKAELIASIDSLRETDQFQIIFYNEDSVVFRARDLKGGMALGDARHKQLARQFIGGITADGATQHEQALVKALRLQPDVLFFLTDADQPALTPHQLQTIQKLNAGRTAIHAIEFGMGTQFEEDNFIMKLARENGGRYTYVDITKFSNRR